jgi:hypothetical protein
MEVGHDFYGADLTKKDHLGLSCLFTRLDLVLLDGRIIIMTGNLVTMVRDEKLINVVEDHLHKNDERNSLSLRFT